MADEAAEFWSAFERETGEKVEARSIGEYYKDGDGGIGLWGLLVLTDKSFRFKHMPSDNWLMALFKRADRGSGPKEAFDLAIPRDDIVALIPPKRGFIARLFGPAFPHFSLKRRGHESEESYIFAADPSSGLIAALAEATGAKASSAAE
jgi:hypothetical protein